MALKSAAYDSPIYTARQSFKPPANVAGASKVFDKFLAFTGTLIFAVHVGCVTAGTSTYTAWNDTATVTTTGTGDTVTGFRVFAGGGTATYGPFAVDVAAGGVNSIPLGGTATGTASYLGTNAFNGSGSVASGGGIALAKGDQFYVVRGTDATAVQTVQYEFGIVPGADVTA